MSFWILHLSGNEKAANGEDLCLGTVNHSVHCLLLLFTKDE